MVEWGNAQTLKALQINSLIPDLTSYIAFCMETSASQELNWGEGHIDLYKEFRV